MDKNCIMLSLNYIMNTCILFCREKSVVLGVSTGNRVQNFARLVIVSRVSGVAGLGSDKRCSYYIALPQGFCIMFSLLQTDLVWGQHG